MAQTTRLTAVGEEFLPDHPQMMEGQSRTDATPPPPRRTESMVAQLLVMTLRTLPAKLIVALASLADLAMIASVFALCLLIIAEPTQMQLTAIGGYAAFVLIALFVRRRH